MRASLFLSYLLTAVSASAQFSSFTITDLSSVQSTGYTYTVSDMNNSGAIVGTMRNNSTNVLTSFLISGGTITDLSAAETATINHFQATAINNSGQIAGTASAFNGVQSVSAATLYQNGSFSSLNLGLGVTSGVAINNNGAVAGYSSNPSPQQGIIISSTPSINHTLAGSLLENGTSYFNGINDLGAAVGRSQVLVGSTIENHALLFSNGTLTDLGTLGGATSEALRINNSGVILGRSTIDSTTAQHAFLYANGITTDLGTLGATSSSGADINDLGVVVGTVTNGAPGPVTSFIYSATGGMQDLSALLGFDANATLGYRSFTPRAINDNNEIVGIAAYFDGTNTENRIVVLTPTAVPEPAAFALGAALAASLSVMVFRRRSPSK